MLGLAALFIVGCDTGKWPVAGLPFVELALRLGSGSDPRHRSQKRDQRHAQHLALAGRAARARGAARAAGLSLIHI